RAGDDRGTLAHVPGHSVTGDWFSLRAELDLLIVFSTAPHRLDPARDWRPAGIRLAVVASARPDPADPSRTHRAQSARALELSERSTA
ncbi:MAG TPA: hypothetical protein VFU73_13685, partial [Actinocrinis sp.]|nr:hypothetical protein [Actinocrinis sp.]